MSFWKNQKRSIGYRFDIGKATFTANQENKNRQFILCVGNGKGGSASLLFISNKHCYIFDPHSRSSSGIPIDSGTSILASFKSRINMILHIHLVNSMSECCRQSPRDLYLMCVVSFDQVNIQMQNYFDNQNYQFLKSKPLGNDFVKQRKDQNEMFANENKKCLHKQDIAKTMKVKDRQRQSKKRKNDHEMC